MLIPALLLFALLMLALIFLGLKLVNRNKTEADHIDDLGFQFEKLQTALSSLQATSVDKEKSLDLSLATTVKDVSNQISSLSKHVDDNQKVFNDVTNGGQKITGVTIGQSTINSNPGNFYFIGNSQNDLTFDKMSVVSPYGNTILDVDPAAQKTSVSGTINVGGKDVKSELNSMEAYVETRLEYLANLLANSAVKPILEKFEQCPVKVQDDAQLAEIAQQLTAWSNKIETSKTGIAQESLPEIKQQFLDKLNEFTKVANDRIASLKAQITVLLDNQNCSKMIEAATQYLEKNNDLKGALNTIFK